eukprot:TRINITY_DN35471_c0_g1_i1.p1 TRINITY_DN35471_c0_g1~~TRINITY_DN35471_c0_g1_i1.p1  ORF type:complete len:371 (-),score=42.03 TRINITY_DN35471_c0_g1_i1:182-1273(-)
MVIGKTIINGKEFEFKENGELITNLLDVNKQSCYLFDCAQCDQSNEEDKMRNHNYKSGVLSGLCSATMWGLDTALMGVIGLMAVFTVSEATFIVVFVTAFFHDIFSAIWTFIFLSAKKKLGGLSKAIRTKSAFYVVIAALMGGPIGMSGYLLAINLIGPSYTAIISSLYPAVGAILSYFLLKEKINKKAWIGLMAAVLGVILLGYQPKVSSINIFGFLCAGLCVIGWGSECVICAYGMKQEIVTSEYALQIRQLTSAVVYGLLLIPIVGGIGLSVTVLKNNALWWIGATAFVGTVSYLCYYNAIYKIGATRAMGLNITYVVFSIIFDKLLLTRTFDLMKDLKTIICAALVIVGVYFVAKEPIC